jgi:hypothetical protein
MATAQVIARGKQLDALALDAPNGACEHIRRGINGENDV